jgi:hypothetical protein
MLRSLCITGRFPQARVEPKPQEASRAPGDDLQKARRSDRGQRDRCPPSRRREAESFRAFRAARGRMEAQSSSLWTSIRANFLIRGREIRSWPQTPISLHDPAAPAPPEVRRHEPLAQAEEVSAKRLSRLEPDPAQASASPPIMPAPAWNRTWARGLG